MNIPRITGHAVALMAIALYSTMAGAEADSSTRISLNDTAIQRLDIRFATLRANDSSHGFHAPAVVIHSPNARSGITTVFSGRLSEWHHNGGDTVTAGEAIATLVSSELAAIQQRWIAARHHLSAARIELEKDRKLFDDGIISRQQLLQSERQYQQAIFDHSAYQRQLTQAGFSATELEALLANQLPPGEYTLKAPQSGELSRSYYASGDPVEANQAVATITSAAEALWVRASVSAALVEGLQPGDSLSILGEPTPLVLVSRNKELSATTQTLEILARFTAQNSQLPGRQVTLVLPSAINGVHVPGAAVTHTGTSTYVYVRHADGIEARQLTLLPLGNDYLATSDLQAGEQLVVQGSALLKGIQLGLGGGE